MARWSPPQGNTTGQKFGVSNQSGNGSATTFTISHGLGTIPTVVLVTPGSSAAAGAWATASSSNITITFTVAPTNGASLVFNWMVQK